MTLQKIHEELNHIIHIIVKLEICELAKTPSGYSTIAQTNASINKIKKLLCNMVEFRSGDKAILQAVIAGMPNHPHVDDTVSRRALERLVSEMNA